MNQLGVHALVWRGGWSESEAALAIAETKRAGYDLIEIPLLDPASVDAAMTRRLLDKHGLTATCSLAWRRQRTSRVKPAAADSRPELGITFKCANNDMRHPEIQALRAVKRRARDETSQCPSRRPHL